MTNCCEKELTQSQHVHKSGGKPDYTLCSNLENAKSQISPNAIGRVKVKHGIEKKADVNMSENCTLLCSFSVAKIYRMIPPDMFWMSINLSSFPCFPAEGKEGESMVGADIRPATYYWVSAPIRQKCTLRDCYWWPVSKESRVGKMPRLLCYRERSDR